MKRFLLASFVSFLGLCSYAQDAPQITLTAEVDGQPRTFELGSAVGEANVVTVDWGDGNVVEGTTLTVAYDGYNATKVTGTPVGDGRIRIFATGALSYFDCVSKVDASGITALDVSRAVELIELAANGNKLTTLDLSKNVKLTKARLGNNALAGVTLPPSLLSLDLRSNRLTSFDGTQVPQLQTLYLSNNTIERLDLSQNTTLKSIYLLDMGLKSFKLGANTTNKLYVSVNGNKLTTLDVTEATGLATGRLFAVNNDLQELKYSAIGVANLSGNRFTLATLPVANITTLTYAPQQPMAIGDIIGSIDLSAQNNIQGFTTTYTWSTLGGKNLEPGTDYTEEAGVFTFLKEQADSVYCVMSTEAFPKFTGANAFRTTAVPMQLTAPAVKPQITLTAEVDGQPRTFELGSALGETNVVTVDWGDGNVVEGVTLTVAYDGYNATKVTGTPVGEGRIRIFATGGLSYFDCVSKVDASGITALDVSRAVELIELAANGNKLTTLDLSQNVKLTKARLGNNALAGVTLPPSLLSLDLRSNRLTSFDGTQVPQLQTLYLSNNAIERLDLSQNTALKSIYLLDMGLKSFRLGANTTNKLYVSVNGNKLTTLDVTEATGLATGRLFATNNDLQELKYSAIGVANLSGNRFTLATLPVANITTLTYAPQQPMAIGDIIGSIDLSAQNNIQGFTTTYTWSTLGGKNLEPGTDYTEEAGVFTFLKEQADSVYCVMSTEAFPKFTGANAFRTTAVPMQVPTGIDGPQAVSGSGEAETYSLDGILVRKNATGTPKHKGIYVIRRNGKTSKTVVK